MTHWFSDFLVGRVIQVNVNCFLSAKIRPIAEVPQGSLLSPLPFLIYVNDLSNLHHRQNSKSPLADDTALGLLVKMYNLQQNVCIRTYGNWQSGVQMENETKS